MSDWREIHDSVADLVKHWRWEEPAKTVSKDVTVLHSNEYNPALYNYSYSEWRKKRSYYRTDKDAFYKIFIVSLMPMRHNDTIIHPNIESQNNVYASIKNCVIEGIPINDLLVGTLYSSYHLVSPYILPTLKYLLINYKSSIDYTVTSISNPRYNISHIAAMCDDIELLSLLYLLGGNIDIIDGQSYSPLYISLGKGNYNVSSSLLMMNAFIDKDLLINKLSQMSLRHFMCIMSCFQHFLFQIDISIQSIYISLQNKSNTGIDINNDIIQSIVSFSLPCSSYQSIKNLMKCIQNNNIPQIKLSWNDIISDAKMCLDELINLKKELNNQDPDDNINGSTNGLNGINDNKIFLDKMILCNLFKLIIDAKWIQWMQKNNQTKWKKALNKLLGKKEKQSLFHNHTATRNLQKIKISKYMVMGVIMVSAAAVVIKQFIKQ